MPKGVYTNMNPEDVNESLLQTFTKWVNFALGVGELGGRTLGVTRGPKTNTNYPPGGPSGRLAAALRAETDQDGNMVALYLDENEIGSQINSYLMKGHKSFSMKDSMLKPGLKGVRMTQNKKGPNWLYRYVPISSAPKRPLKAFAESYLKNLFTSKVTDHGGIIQLNRNAARMWTKNYSRAHAKGATKIRVMSNKPGSANWIVPAMPAFNVAKLLRDTLPAKLKGRVLV